jgi:hypothetical protein
MTACKRRADTRDIALLTTYETARVTRANEHAIMCRIARAIGEEN